MKKIYFLIACCIILSSKSLLAGPSLGLFAGFSTPNNFDNLQTTIENGADLTKIIREGMSTGYHVGAELRYSLSDNFMFTGNVGWQKFPESNLDVINPDNGDTLAHLTSVQNIIPITAGVNFYLLHSIVGIYGVGELSYNYLYSSIDAQYGDVPVQIDESAKTSRVGFGIGAGLDFDISLATLNLELKYNIANLIGKETGEKDKNYLSISLGVLF